MNFSTRKVKNALRRHGVRGCLNRTFAYLYSQIRDNLPTRRKYLRAYLREQLDFDTELNIKTWQIVGLNDLQIDSPSLPFGTNHEPSAVRFVAIFLAQLRIDFKAFTFVDLGSGLGRSVFVAGSLAPFNRLIGVEFSPELSRGSLENLTACRRDRLKSANIEFLCLDASEYEFPLTPLVIHLYNPFGPEILEKVLARIEASLLDAPREVYVLYRNSTPSMAKCLAVFEGAKVLNRIWADRFFTIWAYLSAPPRISQPEVSSPALEVPLDLH